MSNLQSGANSAQMIELFNSIKFPIMGAGGGFAPIGTINFFDASVAPQGWLACDGSTYNIANYPELATYYASVHGSANFYGGDGTTTFAVPDLRGEFLRGTGTNSHTNQGSGANVGVHQDGTIHLGTYSRSNNNGLVVSNNDTGDVKYPQNTDYLDNQSGTLSKSRALMNKSSVETNNIALDYTSRPTNTSFLICVKATLSDANLDTYTVYSPVEHQVGWWQETVDGVLKKKPLYEKTVDCGSMPNSSSQDKYVDTNIQNIDYCMIYEATMYKKSSGEFSRLPMYNVRYGQSSSHSVQIMDTNRILLRSGGDASSYSCNAVLRYTKTTDEWQTV